MLNIDIRILIYFINNLLFRLLGMLNIDIRILVNRIGRPFASLLGMLNIDIRIRGKVCLIM